MLTIENVGKAERAELPEGATGADLRWRRKSQRGVSQHLLADACGVSQETISRWERQTTPFSRRIRQTLTTGLAVVSVM
ncbi:MAG: helix-turn-helix transcriptional regulator [Candidatus Paceibacterota bacterium]|jgi:transcriptional regulator with XRE-family HTH domain